MLMHLAEFQSHSKVSFWMGRGFSSFLATLSLSRMRLEGQILLLSAFCSIIWQFKFHLKRRMHGWHCRSDFKNISDA